MKYAILSDIHANLEALTAALDYLDGRDIDCYWFPGDVVNYGANPNECLEIVTRIGTKFIRGNHEQALSDEALAMCFNIDACNALKWTRKNLEPRWLDRLKDLPLLCDEGSLTMGHGSIECPERFDYLYGFEDAAPSLERLRTPVGFIGHTHIPQVFRKNERSASYLAEGRYPLDRKETYLINAGSVGQPRDRDSRLALAVFDEGEYVLELIRLPYNNQKAAQKIREAGLPPYLADRLL